MSAKASPNQRIIYFTLASLILLGMFTSAGVKEFTKLSSTALKEFIRAKGNFQLIRENDPDIALINQIKSSLSPASRIDISPSIWNHRRVKIRYALYPNTLHKDWDYFIDFDRSIQDPSGQYNTLKTEQGVTIYGKKHAPWPLTISDSREETYPLAFIVAVFLLISIFKLALGCAVLAALNVECQPWCRSFLMSTAFLIGVVTSTVLDWVYLWAGGPFRGLPLFALWALLFLCLVLACRRRFTQTFNNMLRKRSGVPHKKPGLVGYGMGGILLFLVLVILALTVLSPISTWDAYSHWTYKSKIVLHEGSLDFRHSHHNEYPILWPLHVAEYFLFAGGPYDEMARWASALFFLCLLGQLHGGLNSFNLSAAWRRLILAGFMLAFLSFNLTTAYAENGFYCFLTATIIGCLLYIQKPSSKHLVLAGLMALGLSTIKLEGMVSALFIGFALFSLDLPRVLNNRFKNITIAVFCGMLLPTLWIIRQAFMGHITSPLHITKMPSMTRISTLTKTFFIAVCENTNIALGIFLFIFILTSVLNFQKNRGNEENFLQKVIFLHILFVPVAFSAWNYINIPVVKEFMYRLFLHVLPIIALSLGLFAEHNSDVQ